MGTVEKQPVHIRLQSRLNRGRRHRITRTNTRRQGAVRLILHADALLQKHLQELVSWLFRYLCGAFGFGTETVLRHRQHTHAKETRRRQLGRHTLTWIRRTEIIHLRLHTVQRNLRAQPRLIRTKNRTVRGRNHQARVSLNSRT